jgi:hypothetical protein
MGSENKPSQTEQLPRQPVKRKRRKSLLNSKLLKESLRLYVETNRHFLYESSIQTAMCEAAFKLAEKRRMRDYVA